MAVLNPSFLIIGSPTARQIETNDKKNVQIRLEHSKRHTITIMRHNINMDSTIAGSLNVVDVFFSL